MPLPTPDFYRRDDVGTLYQERAAHVAENAETYRKQHNIQPAARDSFRIAAFGIDCQVGFCLPDASLYVPGAVDDTQRTVEWIYSHLDKITGLHFSLDTHRVFQIFHPAWWSDENGNHPAPLTPISHDDIRSGKWKPLSHPRECLEYAKKLEHGGKYQLVIWPYHTLLGGASHILVPALMEAAIFHSLTRMRQTHFETKGTHSLTENYSVLSPEVTELGNQSVGSFNAQFFKMLMDFDRIYVFGQAKSHCVLSPLRDIEQHVKSSDPDLAKKVWILEDAMSSVPAPPLNPLPAELNFPAVANSAIEDFRRAGMNIVKTTDPVTF